jgi:hypothetical protein
VVGLNTARSFTTQYGRINGQQLAAMADRFRSLGPEITKILVTHHPFDLPVNDPNTHTPHRSRGDGDGRNCHQ